MRVIDRHAVVALDLNPIDLPAGMNPKGGNGHGDGQEDNPEESHVPHLIKNRAGTEVVSAISQSEWMRSEYGRMTVLYIGENRKTTIFVLNLFPTQ